MAAQRERCQRKGVEGQRQGDKVANIKVEVVGEKGDAVYITKLKNIKHLVRRNEPEALRVVLPFPTSW